MKRFLLTVNFSAVLIIILCAAWLLTGCTFASITTTTGVNIKYADFHPTGNAVEIDADWQGVGSLRTTRESEGAESIIEAAVPIL